MTEEIWLTVPALVAQGVSREEIAERLGIKKTSLQVLASKRGISLRKDGPRMLKQISLERLSLKNETILSLRMTAEKMGKPTTRLVTELLEIIAKDGLYKAVLDEERA